MMVCLEVGKAGLRTSRQFGQQYQLPAAVTNGYITKNAEMPTYGQLGCQGFIVLGLYGEFAVQRTVPCYIEANKGAFGAVERLLASLWGVHRAGIAPPPPPFSLPQKRESPTGAQASVQRASQTPTGVAEMDEEHEALDKAMESLQASADLESLSRLLELWETHSQHEEELFARFDFGRHRSAPQGSAATAPHCEHHRRIACMMRSAIEAASATCCKSLPANLVPSLCEEIARHAEVYDVAYSGKLVVAA